MKEICQRLEKAITHWPELDSPSFVQGMLVGELCGSDQLTPSEFISRLLQELEAQSIKEHFLEVLFTLYERTLAGLTSSQCDLVLCLPDDDTELMQRAQALGQWCEGFVYGFGLTHGDQGKLQEDVKEYLEAVLEISSIDVSSLEGQQDDELEAQLEELIEFVRIGAIAVYEFLHPTTPKAPVIDSIPEPTHKTIQ